MTALRELRDLYEDHMRESSTLPEHAWPTLSTRYKGKPEKKIKKQIVDYIKWSQAGDAWAVENQGQYVPGKVEFNVIGKAVQVSKSRFMYSANRTGHSDIQAIVGGRALFIELKRIYAKGKDRQSKVQKKFQASVEAAGATYMIVHDLDDFVVKFKEYMK